MSKEQQPEPAKATAKEPAKAAAKSALAEEPAGRPAEIPGKRPIGKQANRLVSSPEMISHLMMRLLPVQILLQMINAVNGIVSSLFASNCIGEQAMSAIGLYFPVTMILMAASGMMVGGSQILCGKYMGKNQTDRTNNVFTLDLLLAAAVSLLVILALLGIGGLHLTGISEDDPAVRQMLDHYMMGQAIGILPLMIGQQLAAFLSLENRMKRTIMATIAFIVVNLVLNAVFVAYLDLGIFGLALASALGQWVFCFIQASYFLTQKAVFRFRFRDARLKEIGSILRIGAPGSLTFGYEAIRLAILNTLIIHYVGSEGLSALTAVNQLLSIFWAIPLGMLAVSRMVMSVSIGEEDRQTLTDIMRTVFRRYIPLMCLVSAMLIALAMPLANLFYHDPSDPVFMMTVWGFRLIPVCMPMSIVSLHFSCYGQASGQLLLVNMIAFLDGLACVAGYTALMIPFIGMNSVYFANILNGVTNIVVIILYAWVRGKGLPRTMDELMVIPEEFGAADHERLDLSVRSVENVVRISETIYEFCRERGVSRRQTYYASLAMEEMAGNVISHGFSKDRRKHAVDVRVVCRDGADELILRISDDCRPFDPGERLKMSSLEMGSREDLMKNIGIRMIYKEAREVMYQNILGLNVLTVRV